MEKKFIFILTFSFLAVLATVQANSSVLLPVWSLDSEYSSIVTDGTCPLAFGTLQSRESSSCLCVGDFNGDGYVDLLDVAPFVEILNSGRFDPCADINGDGHVNLLDVGPFVDLIEAGASCCLCLGDLNGDGVVDLLDVAPFVEILNSGGFDLCADINGDGHVNLLDVGLFVDLIQTGGNCTGGSAAPKGVIKEAPSIQDNINKATNKLGGSAESSICLCLGDFNGDGYVNLLDVGPFVDILNSGRFDPCADINGDGHVNLLDVGPFVDLIQTGGNCAGESAASKGATREDFSQEETNNTLNKLYEQLGMERLVSDLQIFPNPASDVLQVALDMNKSASITLHIYNISGQKMFAQKVQASKGHNTIPISVNALTSGLYLLEINDGNSLKTKNFTIDK